MRDNFNRNINYARISLTERCNLRCIYCMPDGYKYEDLNEITKDEVKKVVDALSEIGIDKIRFTGGEPLVRNDIVDIIRETKNNTKIKHIAITTNGVLLEKYLEPLFDAGLTHINISLDSLKEDVFKKITKGNIGGIISSIKKAIDLGMNVKINMLPMVGYNEKEIIDFIELTKDLPIEVRFIELMPMGSAKAFQGIKSDYILDVLKNNNKEYEKVEGNNRGPAIVYRINGYRGKIGVISPMSHSFCSLCNRIRITSDKKLKTCLHNSGEIDLSPYLENEDKLISALKNGISKKYEKHRLNEDKTSDSGRDMFRIGG